MKTSSLNILNGTAGSFAASPASAAKSQLLD